MKFSLFAHMERLGPGQDQHALYDEFVSLCQFADASGFHAVWTGEHHGMDFTIAPNPFTLLVDLAHRTQHVRLGTATVVAPFWHPIKLAGEAAMTDLVTGGRLELGIARGAYTYEFERLGAVGLDAVQAGKRMRALVPAVKGLWDGDFELDNEFWKFPATTSAPKPVQQPHPPIWIAARDPDSHAFAVANGCHVQCTPLWNPDDEVESLMERFDAACAERPSCARPKIMVLRHTLVGETEAELSRYADGLSQFYNYFGAWFRNNRPVVQGNIQPLTDAEMAANQMMSPSNMRANNVVGTPDEVITRLKRYEELGFDEYSLWVDCGLPYEAKRRSLELFVERVMPAFT
ncbi:MAG: LLM class flavin-dependent oxidoreductase [Pseudomonadota bacterium]